MAVRTSARMIREVIEVDEDLSTSAFTPFIRIANSLVDKWCTNSGYTDEHLTDIETWLAAHFYGVWDRQVTQQQIGPTMETYQSKIDYTLKLTHQGQTAMLLDWAGNLAALNNALQDVTIPLNPTGKKKVGLTWLGSDEIPEVP